MFETLSPDELRIIRSAMLQKPVSKEDLQIIEHLRSEDELESQIGFELDSQIGFKLEEQDEELIYLLEKLAIGGL